MSIFPYDLPGIPENNTAVPPTSQYALQMETYGYMESKPYPRALVVGRGPMRNLKWVGYPNARVGWGRSDDNAYIVPKIPINPKNFNAPVPFPTNATFNGQAPIRGIFTGVSDEVAPCR